MAKVATITADFRAEAAQFLRELKKVNSETRKSAQVIQRELGDALRSLGTIVGVGAFTAFVKASADAADQMAKTADQLGIGVERLQALRFAAQDAGAEFETLDKALLEGQKRLADFAQTGKGPAAEWLERFNLNVRELRRLAPDQLFQRYGEAIKTLGNRGDQILAAQALMGKGAEKLLNLIDGGQGVIEQAAQNIRALGIELTRVDAAQIEHANDALDRMKAISQGVGQQIAVAISPYVQHFVEQIVNAGKGQEGLRSRIEITARVAFTAFEVMANGVRVFDAAVSSVVFGVSKLGEVSARVMRTIVENFAKGEQGPRRFGEIVLGTARALLETTATIDRAVGLDSLADKFQGAADHVNALQIEIKNLTRENAQGLINQYTKVEAFWASMAEQAAARVKTALGGIKSFEQITAETDRIVSEARRRAEEEAAARANQGGAGGGDFLEAEQLREKLLLMEEYQRIHADTMVEIQRDQAQRSADITRELDEQAFVRAQEYRQKVAIDAEQAILKQRQATANAALGLLQAFAGKSKTIAIALVAINKARAIAEAVQNTAVAVTKALAVDPTGSLATRVKVMGAIQVAAIAATGFAEIAQIRDFGGSGAPLGSPTNPVNTQDAGANNQGAQPGKTIQVIINGPVAGPDASRWLIDQISELINGNDTIIINSNSRQAAEIRGE